MDTPFHTTEREPDERQQPLTRRQIVTLCERGFGHTARVESARELGGGEYNTTYLVRLAGTEPVILRVAPSVSPSMGWDERDLMRKEQAIQPYFAPIAPLMPRTLMVDFTHQLIDRDYMFQTYMPGERWSDVEGELTPEEDDALWRQCARIARTIHEVEGDYFGYPHPGPRFPSWSQAVLYAIEQVASEMTGVGLDTADILAVRCVASENRPIFDEIARPHLTHGDLWPVNMLIERGANGPVIVAVIDADRAWWCDPLADWTIHLFRIKTTPRALRNQAIFWDEYGPRQQDASGRLRELVYDGMHTAGILASTTRQHDDKVAGEAAARMHDIVAILSYEGYKRA